ncbi:MAG: alkaline phosphatase family protein [Verrucomicrobia bacterium]|nr:alkaline phosphatase family protein [Verrucomicrobiota bacterium]
MRVMILCLGLLGNFFSPILFAAGRAEHVVVVVWDGLRSDFVTEQFTPTLYQLGREGVVFQNHHAVYLSITEVNGTALATGAYPAHSGIVANNEFRPQIDPLKAIGTEARAAMQRGDQLTRGHYLRRPTLAEVLQSHARKTVIAGAKPVVLLHDRSERTDNDYSGINLFAGNTLPRGWLDRIGKLLGPFPALEKTKAKRDDWTTRALIGPLWEDGVPPFSLLWLSEPDYSQHETGPGSATSVAMLKNSDNNLALVLQELETKGLRAKTDVFVVSDHGFSTISGIVDVAGALTNAGFKATREFKSPPAKGDILVVGNGGSVVLYITGHDSKLTRKVVDFLQGQSFSGVLFTRKSLPGTFALETVGLNSPDAPDVVIALRWSPDKNAAGTPGLELCDEAGRQPEQGIHGTLSRFDMHNTLIASGPDFRRGFVSSLPSGNVDVAPTVLWIFGIKSPLPMDGRVLTEALMSSAPEVGASKTARLEAKKVHDKFVWQQYLKTTKVNGVTYIDEGNGGATEIHAGGGGNN